MCGRASLTSSPEEIEEAFDLTAVPALTARYNIAPTEPMLAVRANEAGDREAVFLRWGLVRPGSEDARAPINLRMETAAKGAMRKTLARRRCIVPLSGFYEWKKAGKARQPFNVRRKDGKLFGVAGLWERLESGDQAPLESCLVLTTAANEIVKPIHERMPVIMDPTSYGSWLAAEATDPKDLLAALRLLPEESLESYPVSVLVNRAGVEDPRCLEPAKPIALW
jgi:putative SOS response-associated peptidase YedK